MEMISADTLPGDCGYLFMLPTSFDYDVVNIVLLVVF